MLALILFALVTACVVMIVAIIEGDNRVLRDRVARLESERERGKRCG